MVEGMERGEVDPTKYPRSGSVCVGRWRRWRRQAHVTSIVVFCFPVSKLRCVQCIFRSTWLAQLLRSRRHLSLSSPVLKKLKGLAL